MKKKSKRGDKSSPPVSYDGLEAASADELRRQLRHLRVVALQQSKMIAISRATALGEYFRKKLENGTITEDDRIYLATHERIAEAARTGTCAFDFDEAMDRAWNECVASYVAEGADPGRAIQQARESLAGWLELHRKRGPLAVVGASSEPL